MSSVVIIVSGGSARGRSGLAAQGDDVLVPQLAGLDDAAAQVPLDHIKGDHHAHVPDVAIVVDRDAADVHANLPRHDGLEILELAGQRIVEAEHPGNFTRCRTLRQASTIFVA